MKTTKPIKKEKIIIISLLCVVALLIIALLLPYILVNKKDRYVKNDIEKLSIRNGDVILVLGGGVQQDGTPKPMLRNRLDAALRLYETGRYRRIIVSGDNRFEFYNEPSAMKNYLVAKGIQEEVIQEDFAGRSTYESCERAVKIFGLKQVVIVSQASHLARAIYLCNSFGLKAEGYAAENVSSLSNSQRVREIMANTKAVFNVYFVGEKTVLGDPIAL